MALDFDAVVTISVAKQIAENLREAIIAGRLKVGERLPTEEDLARSYQVSRPTIREALKRLAAQNLVHSRRGPTGGNFVMRPRPEQAAQWLTCVSTPLVALGAFSIADLVTARREMESVCCRLAATARSDDDMAAMAAEIAIQQREGLSDEEFWASDERFHRALADASGNAPIRFIMHVVIEAARAGADQQPFRPRERRIAAACHKRILAALRERDPEAAVAALHELIGHIGERALQPKHLSA